MLGMKLQFSIRDLFWLVLLVALAIGWYVDHDRSASRRHELEAEIATYQHEDTSLVRARLNLLWKIVSEFNNKPGYEELTKRLASYKNEVRND
jgi:hypothetical protein